MLYGKKEERLIELDYVRSIAMLAVIVIHVSSTFIYTESAFSLFNMNLAFILNQAAHFSVPLFVLLSGMALSISQSNLSYVSFVKKRLSKII